jgi:hypothetical protein
MHKRHKAAVTPMPPNEGKILEAIAFLIIRAGELSYEVTVYDLVKSLFLADKIHLNRWGRPVTFLIRGCTS